MKEARKIDEDESVAIACGLRGGTSFKRMPGITSLHFKSVAPPETRAYHYLGVSHLSKEMC